MSRHYHTCPACRGIGSSQLPLTADEILAKLLARGTRPLLRKMPLRTTKIAKCPPCRGSGRIEIVWQ